MVTVSPGCNAIIYSRPRTNGKAFRSVLGFGVLPKGLFSDVDFRFSRWSFQKCSGADLPHTCAADFQTSILSDGRNAAEMSVWYLLMVPIHCELHMWSALRAERTLSRVVCYTVTKARGVREHQTPQRVIPLCLWFKLWNTRICANKWVSVCVFCLLDLCYVLFIMARYEIYEFFHPVVFLSGSWHFFFPGRVLRAVGWC